MLDHVDVTRGLKAGGMILLNAVGQPELGHPYQDYRLAWVDATRIALENELGTRTQPFINTAMVGAFARLMKAPALTAVTAAIEEEITIKTTHNVKAAGQAYDQVQSI